MTVFLIPMTDAYAAPVLTTYQAGIDEGNATFETSAPSWADFLAAKLPEHRFVAIGDDGAVLGWVAVSPTSTRAAYAGVVEHSVYVHPILGDEAPAQHHDQWRDVILIERRSPNI